MSEQRGSGEHMHRRGKVSSEEDADAKVKAFVSTLDEESPIGNVLTEIQTLKKMAKSRGRGTFNPYRSSRRLDIIPDPKPGDIAQMDLESLTDLQSTQGNNNT